MRSTSQPSRGLGLIGINCSTVAICLSRCAFAGLIHRLCDQLPRNRAVVTSFKRVHAKQSVEVPQVVTYMNHIDVPGYRLHKQRIDLWFSVVLRPPRFLPPRPRHYDFVISGHRSIVGRQQTKIRALVAANDDLGFPGAPSAPETSTVTFLRSPGFSFASGSTNGTGTSADQSNSP